MEKQVKSKKGLFKKILAIGLSSIALLGAGAAIGHFAGKNTKELKWWDFEVTSLSMQETDPLTRVEEDDDYRTMLVTDYLLTNKVSVTCVDRTFSYHLVCYSYNEDYVFQQGGVPYGSEEDVQNFIDTARSNGDKYIRFAIRPASDNYISFLEVPEYADSWKITVEK